MASFSRAKYVPRIIGCTSVRPLFNPIKKNQTKRNVDALHELKSRVLINSLQRSWFVPMYGYLDSTNQAYRHNGLQYDFLAAHRNGETARLFGFFLEWKKNYAYEN